MAIHADKALVAVDHSTHTATVTLLTMHAIPKLSEQFDIENYAYELVGEIKIPFTTTISREIRDGQIMNRSSLFLCTIIQFSI